MKNESSVFYAMIIGKLLGDASITKQERRKPRLQFSHRIEDCGWCTFCYDQLKESLPLNSPKYRKTIDERIVKGYSESYFVLSRTSPIITELESMWYVNRTKVIPFDFINKFFSALSLAWWYQDDGNLKIDRKTNTPRKIILSTDNFKSTENEKLIGLLYERYGLHFTLDKQNRLLIYNAQQIQYFLYLVAPYLHSSMFRKQLYYCDLASDKHLAPKRTTLYVPESINLPRPTKMINEQLYHLDRLIQNFRTGVLYEKIYEQHTPYSTTNKSYQIIIQPQHLTNLIFLKKNTGLTYSQLTTLCFL